MLFIEYMEGGSLHHWTHKEPKFQFTLSQVISIGLCIANAGRYLHEDIQPALVHRDITSHNILLLCPPRPADTTIRVKLCDFGISREKLSKGKEKMSPIGNPRWLSPEVIRKEPYSKKADIWSFGKITF
jgi:serine/threonine protein kinase